MDWISVISNNNEAISAIAALLSALTAILLTGLYELQRRELIRQREITSWSTAPRIAVVSTNIDGDNVLDYVLRNQGERIATDIAFCIDWSITYENSLSSLYHRLRYTSETSRSAAFNVEKAETTQETFPAFIEAHSEDEFRQNLYLNIKDRIERDTTRHNFNNLLDVLAIDLIEELTFEIYIEYNTGPHSTDRVDLLPVKPVSPGELIVEDSESDEEHEDSPNRPLARLHSTLSHSVKRPSEVDTHNSHP